MKQLLTFFISLLIIISCQKPKNEESKATFQVEGFNLNFDGGAGDKDSFTIKSTIDWTIEVTPANTSWLKLDVTKGVGDKKIIITEMEKNPTTSPRIATLKITPSSSLFQAVSIVVTQKALAPYLLIDSTSITFLKTQASVDSFQIESNVSWKASPLPYWLSSSIIMGTSSQRVKINAVANDSGLYRATTLLISPTDTTVVKPTKLIITQGTPILQTDKVNLKVAATANSADSTKVQSNIHWKATGSDTWFDLKTSLVNGEKYIVATASQNNTSGSARTAKITLVATEVSNIPPVIINIYQPTVTLISPTVSTNSISNIGSTSAVGGGNVSSDGWSPIITRGICWNTLPNPTIADSKMESGTGTGNFSATLKGLTPNSTFYVRAFATNSVGTAYGAQVTFTTDKILPPVTINHPGQTTHSSANVVVYVSDLGGDPILGRGVCWSTSPNPTTANNKTLNGTGWGVFESTLTNLTPNTTYYVRGYATNSLGTGYSNQIIIKTPQVENIFGTVTDIDGNVYKTIKIGNQTWMAENLKVTKFRDGTPISEIQGNDQWKSYRSAAYCNYNNDLITAKTYGRLYNWYVTQYAVSVAPEGWHVPTDNDWNTLINFLGGESVAGGKLKEAGFVHWMEPNTGASNSSGFTALGAGSRDRYTGVFSGLGVNSQWWSSTAISHPYNAPHFAVTYADAKIHFQELVKWYGFSIRCVKD